MCVLFFFPCFFSESSVESISFAFVFLSVLLFFKSVLNVGCFFDCFLFDVFVFLFFP